jgi:hypothetical protein
MYTSKKAVASCEEEDDDILEVWTPNKTEAALSPAGNFNNRKRTKRVSGKTTGVWPPAVKIERFDRLDGLAPRSRKKRRPAKLGHGSFASNAVTLKKETILDDSRRTNSGQSSSTSNAVGAPKKEEILDDSRHETMGRGASSTSNAVASKKEESIDNSRHESMGRGASFSNAVASKKEEILDDSRHENMGRGASFSNAVASKKEEILDGSSAKKSSPPDTQVASLEPANEKKKADEDVHLGLRVYAEWEDGLYHPAEVIAIKKDNQYSVRSDDSNRVLSPQNLICCIAFILRWRQY